MRRREAETLPGLLEEFARGSRAALLFEDRAISATELGELPSTDSPNGRKVQRSELRRLAAEALQETPTTT